MLVENFRAGTMEKWGMGYAAVLEARFPRLVHCRITGFGADGPLGALPGYDAVVQAFSGLMSINGTADSGPVRMGIPVVDLGTGLIAGNAILMALYERQRSGRGQFLDITLFDCGVSLLHPHAANFFMSGETPKRAGDSHPNIAPYEQLPTRTCNMFVACGNDRQFRRLGETLGRPELADDERFADNAARVANRPALNDVLGPLLAEQDGEELCARLLAAGVPAGPVLDVPAVMDHPHTHHRGMAIEINGYRGTGVPIKLSRTPGAPRLPPPLYNEHGHEVLAAAGYSKAEIAALAASGVLVEERKRLR